MDVFATLSGCFATLNNITSSNNPLLPNVNLVMFSDGFLLRLQLDQNYVHAHVP